MCNASAFDNNRKCIQSNVLFFDGKQIFELKSIWCVTSWKWSSSMHRICIRLYIPADFLSSFHHLLCYYHIAILLITSAFSKNRIGFYRVINNLDYTRQASVGHSTFTHVVGVAVKSIAWTSINDQKTLLQTHLRWRCHHILFLEFQFFSLPSVTGMYVIC